MMIHNTYVELLAIGSAKIVCAQTYHKEVLVGLEDASVVLRLKSQQRAS